MRRGIGLSVLGVGVALVAWVGVTLVWGTRSRRSTPATLSMLSHASWIGRTRRGVKPTDGQHRTRGHEGRRGVSQDARAAIRAQPAGRAPIGRIVIPRIHLEMVVVEGTSTSDLEKGPGHYDAETGVDTSLPGLGAVIAIAGHRTTFLHPFRHIDELRPGDKIYLEMPYGTFRYSVYFHRVVVPTDWSILRPRPYEKLVLTACHPLYSASHRLAVFARLEGETT